MPVSETIIYGALRISWINIFVIEGAARTATATCRDISSGKTRQPGVRHIATGFEELGVGGRACGGTQASKRWKAIFNYCCRFVRTLQPSRKIALVSTVAVVVPSPAASFVLEAT